MKKSTLLEVSGLTVSESGTYTLKDVSFRIKEGECFAISGLSGSGKTLLLDCISRYHLFPGNILFRNENPEVVLVPHQYSFKNNSGGRDFYYQQRFNSTDSENTATVTEEMASAGISEATAGNNLEKLSVLYIRNKPLIQLSSGEWKRFQIAKALSRNPDWLLLDEPYTGLDKDSRESLTEVLCSLIEDGKHILMVSTIELPEFITNIITLDHGILTGIFGRETFLNHPEKKVVQPLINFSKLPEPSRVIATNPVIRMVDVNVAYYGKPALQHINWEVQAGEKWCITGQNGSGKSTLLSLITGDHPQSFASEIYLFGRRRGSGETIWEIKEQTGFLSPELHHYFDKSFTVFDTVASGLFDTIGLFRKLNRAQEEKVEDCLRLFSLEKLSAKILNQLSEGWQRWVLLARIFVKNPPVLILDEPCQGLDSLLVQQFMSFIEAVCSSPGRTVLYVSHVQDEIPGNIKNTLVLKEGKIVEINKDGKAVNSHPGRRDRA